MGAFTLLDYAIVGVYIVASLLIGLRFAGKQKTVDDYFVADRSARWWAVAISAIATGLSAISYLGVPAWVFQNDLQLNVVVFLLPLVMLVVIYLFVPLLVRLRLTTIYEYLERRFNLAVRTFASALFLFLRGGWLATAIYTQSILLVEITGIPMWACVGVVGVLTAFYTILGGMEAVLWTDVMQFFVLVGGLIAVLAAVLLSFGGDVGQIWSLAAAGGHTRAVNLDFSLVQITLWGIVLNYLVEGVATYGSDQVMVQRFLTSRSPAEMRRSVMFTGLLTVPVVILLAVVGLSLVAYYKVHPELDATLPKADRVMPHFVANVLPPGLSGLVIAGVFAATMSTLSAGFNSLATATVIDFIQRFRRTAPVNPRADVTMARWVTFAWAAASTVAALWVGRLGSIVEIFGKINGFFAGPILGVFLLGILTRRAGGGAAMIGLVGGTAFTWWVTTTQTSWLWYSPAGCFSTVFIGYVAGLILPASTKPSVMAGAVEPHGFEVAPAKAPSH
ncbi:MAG TPA: sodium/solute symporter [Tepidisphaeraceae bacterium]|nr:sodium/solute symporter [Tepidisphaeraceae bacterium]